MKWAEFILQNLWQQYPALSGQSAEPIATNIPKGMWEPKLSALQWRKAWGEQLAHKETISGINRNQPHQWHHSIPLYSVDFRIPTVTYSLILVPKEVSQVLIHTYHTSIKSYNLGHSAMQFHKRVSNFKQGLKMSFHFHSCVIIASGSSKATHFPI